MCKKKMKHSQINQPKSWVFLIWIALLFTLLGFSIGYVTATNQIYSSLGNIASKIDLKDTTFQVNTNINLNETEMVRDMFKEMDERGVNWTDRKEVTDVPMS